MQLPQMLKLLAVSLCIALVGCVKPTTYMSRTESKSLYGYFEVTVEENLYRVSFLGNPKTPRRNVSAYALYRSAEIASGLKSPFFKVVEGTLDADLLTADDIFSLVPDVETPKIPAKYVAPTYIYIPYSPPPPPVSNSLLVRMNVAPKSDDKNIFNTEEVLKKLGARIKRAEVTKAI